MHFRPAQVPLPTGKDGLAHRFWSAAARRRFWTGRHVAPSKSADLSAHSKKCRRVRPPSNRGSGPRCVSFFREFSRPSPRGENLRQTPELSTIPVAEPQDGKEKCGKHQFAATPAVRPKWPGGGRMRARQSGRGLPHYRTLCANGRRQIPGDDREFGRPGGCQPAIQPIIKSALPPQATPLVKSPVS
jgi:hypothetical protein